VNYLALTENGEKQKIEPVIYDNGEYRLIPEDEYDYIEFETKEKRRNDKYNKKFEIKKFLNSLTKNQMLTIREIISIMSFKDIDRYIDDTYYKRIARDEEGGI